MQTYLLVVGLPRLPARATMELYSKDITCEC
jgi:hypothetical protein